MIRLTLNITEETAVALIGACRLAAKVHNGHPPGASLRKIAAEIEASLLKIESEEKTDGK